MPHLHLVVIDWKSHVYIHVCQHVVALVISEIIPNRKKTKWRKNGNFENKKTLKNQRIVYNLGNENKIQNYRVIYANRNKHTKIHLYIWKCRERLSQGVLWLSVWVCESGISSHMLLLLLFDSKVLSPIKQLLTDLNVTLQRMLCKESF